MNADWQLIETAKENLTVIGYSLKLPERWVRVGLGCVSEGEWLWYQDVSGAPATHWIPFDPPFAQSQDKEQ